MAVVVVVVVSCCGVVVRRSLAERRHSSAVPRRSSADTERDRRAGAGPAAASRPGRMTVLAVHPGFNSRTCRVEIVSWERRDGDSSVGVVAACSTIDESAG